MPAADRRDVLAQHGLPVHDGWVSADHDERAPSILDNEVWTLRFHFEDLGEFEVTGQTWYPSPGSAGSELVEFVPAKDGLAVWRGTTRSAPAHGASWALGDPPTTIG